MPIKPMLIKPMVIEKDALELNRDAWRYTPPTADLLTCTLDTSLAMAHDLPVGDWQLARINPRDEGHALLHYEHANGMTVVGQWFAKEEIYQQTVSALCKMDRRHVVTFDKQQMLWQLHGIDHKLPGLAALCLAGGELIVHHPTRRGVVRTIDPVGNEGASTHDTVRYHKVVRPNRTAKLASTMQNVHEAAQRVGITTPAVLAMDEARGVVTMSALAGRTLLRVLEDEAGYGMSEIEACGRRAGEVLAKLHGSDLHCSARHDAGAEQQVLCDWLARLATIAPSLHSQISPFASPILERLATMQETLVPLHRDCYDKQFVVNSRDIGLLDFDTLAHGEAALDVANFIVHCQLRADKSVASLARAAHLAASFLQGYDPSHHTLARLVAYADAARLRLICVYGCRPTQCDVVPQLIASLGRPIIGLA